MIGLSLSMVLIFALDKLIQDGPLERDANNLWLMINQKPGLFVMAVTLLWPAMFIALFMPNEEK